MVWTGFLLTTDGLVPSSCLELELPCGHLGFVQQMKDWRFSQNRVLLIVWWYWAVLAFSFSSWLMLRVSCWFFCFSIQLSVDQVDIYAETFFFFKCLLSS
ncbi:hypothetical protein GOODEAATRI_031633 [Goodea atripinnis]|uniref:Uncharacterized protein n=1 Tax=Goodea atripinnis TaxID=208336 RepID=A0ABV0N780_9TELE